MFLGQNYSISSRQCGQGRRVEHGSTRPLIFQLPILHHKSKNIWACQVKSNHGSGHQFPLSSWRHGPQQSVHNLSERRKLWATNTRELDTRRQRNKRPFRASQLCRHPRHFDDRRDAHCLRRNLQRSFYTNVQRFKTILRTRRTQSLSSIRYESAFQESEKYNVVENKWNAQYVSFLWANYFVQVRRHSNKRWALCRPIKEGYANKYTATIIGHDLPLVTGIICIYMLVVFFIKSRDFRPTKSHTPIG